MMMEVIEQGTEPHEESHDDDHDHHHDHDNMIVGIRAGQNSSATLYSTVAGHHHPSAPNSRRSPYYCWHLLVATNIGLLLAVIILTALLVVEKSREHEILSPALAPTTTTTLRPTILPTATTNNNNSTTTSAALSWRALPNEQETLTRIAFGSCSSQRMPQPYWDTLTVSYQPDLVLLMGDNVYGDCHRNRTDDPVQACEPLRRAYREMAQHPSVQGAAKQLSVFPTLDDHDYGMSDADQFNPFKDLARQYFVDFFGLVEEDFPSNNNDGVYRSRVWGPTGKRLQVILLDTRYGRSPFYDLTDPANNTGHILSEQQWSWLEEELDRPADLRLVVSSIQVLNDVTSFECWRHIPAERQRLYDMIRNKSVLLLSGDRHVGGFYTTQDGSIREVTASSWTHTIPFGAFGSNCTSPETCDEKDPRRQGDLIRVNHFGGVDISWENRTASVSLRRAESSYGVPYVLDYPLWLKRSNAGEVVKEQTVAFPF